MKKLIEKFSSYMKSNGLKPLCNYADTEIECVALSFILKCTKYGGLYLDYFYWLLVLYG